MTYATEQSVLNAQFNAALAEDMAATEKLRPFMLIRPRIFKDGNAWCCLYGEDIQIGVVGFGDTPAEASKAFDDAWNGEEAK